jgi:(1->4)-alpha-D-glucan 1-alpha-D-glucosylmutase
MHGYDITNHDSLNPEIGTEAEHTRLMSLLREQGMGHLLDIVPNHMGVGGGANPWWMNVMENGPSSPFARYFDSAGGAASTAKADSSFELRRLKTRPASSST